MTGVGTILGTAAYMAPEQAKGRPTDKRSDMWAFGAVLYEMLTGVRAFDGEDVSDTMAAVLRGEPDWRRLPATLPPALRLLVQRASKRTARSVWPTRRQRCLTFATSLRRRVSRRLRQRLRFEDGPIEYRRLRPSSRRPHWRRLAPGS